MFDWVPTLEEIGNWIDCRLDGHEWVKDDEGKTYCKVCGKVSEQ